MQTASLHRFCSARDDAPTHPAMRLAHMHATCDGPLMATFEAGSHVGQRETWNGSQCDTPLRSRHVQDSPSRFAVPVGPCPQWVQGSNRFQVDVRCGVGPLRRDRRAGLLEQRNVTTVRAARFSSELPPECAALSRAMRTLSLGSRPPGAPVSSGAALPRCRRLRRPHLPTMAVPGAALPAARAWPWFRAAVSVLGLE